jgi:hypothetical protein
MTRLAAVALAIAVAVTSSACTVTRAQRRTAIIGGIASAAAGALVFSQGRVDSDNDGFNENPLNDNHEVYLIGAALFTGGMALLTAGLTAGEKEETAALAMRAAAIRVEPPGPPGLAYAEQRASLPELPATPEVLHMAQQIRALVSDGHCAAAWATWQRLDAVDHAYAIALSRGVMGACPRSALSMR